MLGRLLRRGSLSPDFKAGSQISKFYKLASVRAVPDGFEVTLDGRSLKTPLRNPFKVKSYPLALAIAAEWQCQRNYLKPYTMPIMQMTATAIDLPSTKLRESLVDRMMSFLESDTVCFREVKEQIRNRQDAVFNPVITYMREKYSLDYPVISGMDLPIISPETNSRFLSLCHSFNDFELVAYETAVTVAKSTALGLCLLDGFLPVKTVMKYSRVEEEYQIELFGKVEGSHDLEETQTLMLLSAARILTQLERLRE